MNSMSETAERFSDACEAGKGWDVRRGYCHPDATFSAQPDAHQGSLRPMPDRPGGRGAGTLRPPTRGLQDPIARFPRPPDGSKHSIHGGSGVS